MKEERQNKAQDSVVVLYGMGFVCACFEGRRAATNQQKSQWRLTHMLFFSLSCPCPVHFSPIGPSCWPILPTAKERFWGKALFEVGNFPGHFFFSRTFLCNCTPHQKCAQSLAVCATHPPTQHASLPLSDNVHQGRGEGGTPPRQDLLEALGEAERTRRKRGTTSPPQVGLLASPTAHSLIITP